MYTNPSCHVPVRSILLLSASLSLGFNLFFYFEFCHRNTAYRMLSFQAHSHTCEKHLFALSCPSVRMYQRSFHWTDCNEVWSLGLRWKSVEKFQIWLTSDNTSVSLSVVRNVGNLDTRELIVAFPWTVSYCWQLHVGQQQYKGKVNVKQSHYRPGVVQRVPGS